MLPMQDPFIGWQLALNREIDDAIIEETIKKEIDKGALCINVGANIGYFSLLLAKICSSGKVFVFEPNPKNIEMLILIKNIQSWKPLIFFIYSYVKNSSYIKNFHLLSNKQLQIMLK